MMKIGMERNFEGIFQKLNHRFKDLSCLRTFSSFVLSLILIFFFKLDMARSQNENSQNASRSENQEMGYQSSVRYDNSETEAVGEDTNKCKYCEASCSTGEEGATLNGNCDEIRKRAAILSRGSVSSDLPSMPSSKDGKAN